MVKRRFLVSVGFVSIGLLTLVAFRTWFSPRVQADYAGTAFSQVQNGTPYASDGATNVLIGAFRLPDPVADTLLQDGAGNTVTTKSVLSSFSGTNQMFDTNNNGTFDMGEGVISSANTTLDPSDTVLAGAVNALTTFQTVEGPNNYYMYFDQGVTEGAYDPNEDVYRMVYQGGGCASPDGTTSIRLPEATFAFMDLDSDSTIDWDPAGDTYSANGETLIRDADADGYPSAGDSVIVAQGSRVHSFVAGDKVCFDGSVVNDTDFDPGENIWLDVAGDCAAFTAGVDVILVGVAPTGTSTLASAENELGYLDVNTSDSYTCSRAGTCEAPVYSGANGVNVVNGATIATSATFFDSSMDGSDGLHATGTGWDESGGAENLVDVASLLSGGESLYLFTDCDGSTVFTPGEDVFYQVLSGSAAVIANGVTARTFDSIEKVLLNPGTPISGFTASSGVIIFSADSTLSPGALNGDGTDKALSTGTVLDPIPMNVKYFDHDTSGSFVGSDDIVLDSDNSGYYNADDIISIAVEPAASSDNIAESYLTAINVYQRVGGSCGGTGIDTLIGSDSSAPFFAQPITLTKAPYASSDTLSERTLCIYADAADNSVHGKIWTLQIPTNGAVFASSTSSPTSAWTAVTSPVQFVAPLTTTIGASSYRAGATTSYTFTYTLTEDGIPNAKGLFDATFPSGFDISGSSVTCTDDGSSVAVTPSISGQLIFAVNASGSTVASGSVVRCTVTNVENPSTTGRTQNFIIAPFAGSTSRTLYLDLTPTVTISPAHSSSPAASVTTSISLLSPVGGESYTGGEVVPITWETTGSGISYVLLSYSIDNGATWTSIATNEVNDGDYSWTVPDVSSSTALVKVEGTDLATIVDEDQSGAVFSIMSGTSTSDSSTTDTSSTDTSTDASTDTSGTTETPSIGVLASDMFVKLGTSPTVYYVDGNMVRHPFLDEPTYLTYQESYAPVVVITQDILDQSTEGAAMLVNPGKILVKFSDAPTVYTVGRDGSGLEVLTAIPTEEIIRAVLGDDYASRVLTLPAATFGMYGLVAAPHTIESLSAEIASSTLTDIWYLSHADAALDADGDGAATWMETMWGTDPYNPDTDGDGYNDKLEVDTGHNPFVGGGA